MSDAPSIGAARRVVPPVVAEVTAAFATLGVGKAVTALYNGVSWLADNLNKLNNLATLLAKIAGQVDAVGTGQAGAGDALAKDITTLLNQSVPLVLSFAAAQVPGLSGLPGAIRDTIQKVQGYPLGKVQQAATTVVGKFKGELAGKGGGGSAPGAIAQPVTLTAGGHTVRLWVATQGSKAVVMRSVDGKDIRPLDLGRDVPAVANPTPAQADSRAAAVTALTALQTAADTAVGAMAAAGAVKPAAGAKPSPAFAALTAATADLNTKLTTEITALAAAGATCFFGQACFAAGVPLRTPDGSKPVEDFREGDLVLSRDEHDPTGAAEPKVVEAVFRRTAALWPVRLNGREVGSTAEHPWYVAGKGWTRTDGLAVGDRVLCLDGSTVGVEGVRDAGAWVPVYNLRVADHHTYFVGTQEWEFAAWAHNLSCGDFANVQPGLTDAQRTDFANRGETVLADLTAKYPTLNIRGIVETQLLKDHGRYLDSATNLVQVLKTIQSELKGNNYGFYNVLVEAAKRAASGHRVALERATNPTPGAKADLVDHTAHEAIQMKTVTSVDSGKVYSNLNSAVGQLLGKGKENPPANYTLIAWIKITDASNPYASLTTAQLFADKLSSDSQFRQSSPVFSGTNINAAVLARLIMRFELPNGTTIDLKYSDLSNLPPN